MTTNDIINRIGYGGPSYKRKDANHDQITEECLAAGIILLDTHNLAHFGDCVAIGYHRTLDCPMAAIVEIKTSKGKLSAEQSELKHYLFSEFGIDAPYIEARTAEDVLLWFGAIAPSGDVGDWKQTRLPE